MPDEETAGPEEHEQRPGDVPPHEGGREPVRQPEVGNVGGPQQLGTAQEPVPGHEHGGGHERGPGHKHDPGHEHGPGHEHNEQRRGHEHRHGPGTASYFDTAAPTWDERPGAREQAARVAEAIGARIPLDAGWSALEIGSGTGLLSRELAPQLGPILLIDPSAGMVEVARARLEREGSTQQRAVRADLTTDALDAGQFDIAYSMLAFHHVADVPRLLKTVQSLLRPGGWLAVCDLAVEDGSFHDEGRTDVVHHGFADDDLIDATVEAGFEQVALETIGQIHRPTDQGGTRAYPLVLLTARAPSDEEWPVVSSSARVD